MADKNKTWNSVPFGNESRQVIWSNRVFVVDAGVTGTLCVTDVCNAVVRDGEIYEDCSRSRMVNVYH